MSLTAYDRVRYPGRFYPLSSTDRLATLATLYGLSPAPPARCRVLELGCGDGGNLIPQAARFPGSRFLGVDLAQTAIAAGRELARDVGLQNIEFVAADIASFEPQGEFDYIISHGVLSWIPAPVRQRLLELCGRCLAPQGVAYISYNALPGGYLRSVPRDLMRFHTRHIADPLEKPKAAREIADLVMEASPVDSLGRRLLERELDAFEGRHYFLLHDLLADENEPLYFLDFMAAAGEAGLQYLVDANVAATLTAGLPPRVQEVLGRISDRLEREQYLDFIRLCQFRQTLLCRQGLALDLEVSAPRLRGLYFASPARPARADAAPQDPGALEFRHPQHGTFRAEEPVTKAFALALGRTEAQGTPFDALLAQTAALLGRQAPLDPAEVAALIRFALSLFARDLIGVHAQRGAWCTQVSERPGVSRLNRRLAAAGEPVVTEALGTFVLPSLRLRRLVTLLDGTRSSDTLLEELVADLPPDERELPDAAWLGRQLATLAAHALLTA